MDFFDAEEFEVSLSGLRPKSSMLVFLHVFGLDFQRSRFCWSLGDCRNFPRGCFSMSWCSWVPWRVNLTLAFSVVLSMDFPCGHFSMLRCQWCGVVCSGGHLVWKSSTRAFGSLGTEMFHVGLSG